MSVTKHSKSQRGFLSLSSRSQSTEQREVITPEEVMRLGGEERQVVIADISGKRPSLVKRLNYYEFKPLRKLSQLSPRNLQLLSQEDPTRHLKTPDMLRRKP